MRLSPVLFGTLALLAANVAMADVYKCKAADGSTKFQDRPCDTREEQLDRKRVRPSRTTNAPTTTSAAADLLDDLGLSGNAGNAPASNRSSTSQGSGFGPNSEECRKRKAWLAEYRSQGVRGINPVTGQTGMMTGDAAADAIRMAEENVAIYCSTQ
jgi:hypothetical protein